ncbi:MAG: hypothetical protein ACI9K8_000608, partial [Reinekea sp.]
PVPHCLGNQQSWWKFCVDEQFLKPAHSSPSDTP